MKDAELVQQIKNGNSNAFRFLVLNNQRLVMHIVGRVVQQQEDLEDICQDVFMKVFRQIDKFRGDSKLSTWIATIAYNTSMTHIKRQSNYIAASYDEKPEIMMLEPENNFASTIIEKKEAKQYLLDMIEQLPVQYRTVLTLFHLEEFSYKEIEEITQIPEGTIKSHLSRARKILKEKIQKVTESEKINIFTHHDYR